MLIHSVVIKNRYISVIGQFC